MDRVTDALCLRGTAPPTTHSTAPTAHSTAYTTMPPSPISPLRQRRAPLAPDKSHNAFLATLDELYASRYRAREIQAYTAVKLRFAAEGLAVPPFDVARHVEGWKGIDEDDLQMRLRARARELRVWFEGVDAGAREEEALQMRLRARARELRAWFEEVDAAAAAAREEEALQMRLRARAADMRREFEEEDLQTRLRARAAALRTYFEHLDATATARRGAIEDEEVEGVEKATEVADSAKATGVQGSLALGFSAGLVTAGEVLPFLLMGLFCVGMFELEMRHVWVFLYVFLDWEEGVMV